MEQRGADPRASRVATGADLYFVLQSLRIHGSDPFIKLAFSNPLSHFAELCSTMHPLSAVDIFAEQLVSRGHGLPLWCPEPSPLGEVNVGDVGFIHRGSFFRLFNAICSPTDPSNHQGLPEDFIPLVLPKDEGIRYSDLPVGPICSLSTTWRESTSKDSVTPAYSFSCHCGRGAVVFLQEGARQEYAPSSQTIKTYVQKHHSSWHALAYKLGYSLHPEEIIFVSGCLKASRWAAAAYTQSTPPENTPQHFDYFPQTGFAVSHGSNSRLWMEQRSHTSLSPPSGVVGSCLFVKYYRLSGSRATTCGARTHIKPRGMPNIAILQALLLRARTATANVLGRCVMRCAGSAYMEGTPSANDYPDPLHHLSPYVLKYSSAKIAVVSHDDLYSILPHAEHLSDIPRYLREERVPIEIEGDTGYLQTISNRTGVNNAVRAELKHPLQTERTPGRFLRACRNSIPCKRRRDTPGPISRDSHKPHSVAEPDAHREEKLPLNRASSLSLARHTSLRGLKSEHTQADEHVIDIFDRDPLRRDTDMSNSSTVVSVATSPTAAKATLSHAPTLSPAF